LGTGIASVPKRLRVPHTHVGPQRWVCCDTTAREAHAGGLGLNLTEADYCFLLDPRDFRVLFLRDGTASTGDDAERFQRPTFKVLDGLFAEVVDTDDVLDALAAVPA
jgi:hypothetical protein